MTEGQGMKLENLPVGARAWAVGASVGGRKMAVAVSPHKLSTWFFLGQERHDESERLESRIRNRNVPGHYGRCVDF